MFLSELRLICNEGEKLIISSHQLSLFWPLFVNERFMLWRGGADKQESDAEAELTDASLD